MEKCLRHDDIPCVVSGREDFLEDPTVRGMLAFFRSLMVPSDRAALESALRLVWDCPADLLEQAQELCHGLDRFHLDLLRPALGGYGVLSAWLDRAEEWLPLCGA